MFHLDLGSVPEWVGGLALPLAFIGLARERQDRRREQVGKVGAWCYPPHEDSEDHEAPEAATVFSSKINVRNGSGLPVTVSTLRVGWQALWTFPGPVDRIMQQRSRSDWQWVDIGAIPPTKTFTADIGWGPQFPPGARARQVKAAVIDFVVIDNTGRVWLVRPQSPGTARQVRTRWPRWLPGDRRELLDKRGRGPWGSTINRSEPRQPGSGE